MFNIPEKTVLCLRQRYIIEEAIGEGSSGGVWKIQNGEGIWYAFKLFYKREFDTGQTKNFLNQIHIIQKIEHPHVVPIVGYGLLPIQANMPMLLGDEWLPSKSEEYAQIPYIIMPLASQNLAQALTSPELDPLQRLDFALQFCLGVRKIHSYYVHNSPTEATVEPFFHGNLKLSNLLLFQQGKKLSLKISDLGFSTGTADFPEQAPEQREHQDTDYRSDLFCIAKILQTLIQEPNLAITDILDQLLNPNPNQRPPLLPKLIQTIWEERTRIYKNKLAYTMYLLGLNLYQAGQFDYALQDFARAIKLYPNFALAWLGQADTLRQLGKTKEALDSYDQSIALDHSNALAYENRGELFGEQGDYANAIVSFKKALDLDPTAASVHGSLGLVYGNMQEWEKALEQFSRLIDIHKDFPAAYADRAEALVHLKRFEEALEDYRHALELNIDEPQAIQVKIQEIENIQNKQSQ